MENGAMDWRQIGKRAQKVRKAGKISQKDFGEMMDAAVNTVGTWEQGETRYPVEAALKLCEITGTSLDYIYRGIPSSGDITEAEFSLIDMFRKADAEGREAIWRAAAIASRGR